jgi:hypothetical protein
MTAENQSDAGSDQNASLPCAKCGRARAANEVAVYGDLCEDCYCRQRTHAKHFKTGGEKGFSAGRSRGQKIHVRKVI